MVATGWGHYCVALLGAGLRTCLSVDYNIHHPPIVVSLLKPTNMHIVQAGVIAGLYVQFERVTKILEALQTERQMYFFIAGENHGVLIPDEIRPDMIRHYRKAQETLRQDIENFQF
jgi:hypothetical protein